MYLNRFEKKKNEEYEERKKHYQKTYILKLHELFQPTEEEHQEVMSLLKKEFKNVSENRIKDRMGIPEYIFYNIMRGKPFFNGIEKMTEITRYADKNQMYSWKILPIEGNNQELHRKLNKILGYKYTHIIITMRDNLTTRH